MKPLLIFPLPLTTICFVDGFGGFCTIETRRGDEFQVNTQSFSTGSSGHPGLITYDGGFSFVMDKN